MRNNTLIILTAAALLAGSSHATGQESSTPTEPEVPVNASYDPFVGTWKLSCTPITENGKPFTDDVLFDGTEFAASACAMYGFRPSLYTPTEDNGIRFECESTSQSHGTMTWRGTPGGSGLVGTLTWIKPNGDVHTYTIEGKRLQVASAE